MMFVFWLLIIRLILRLFILFYISASLSFSFPKEGVFFGASHMPKTAQQMQFPPRGLHRTVVSLVVLFQLVSIQIDSLSHSLMFCKDTYFFLISNFFLPTGEDLTFRAGWYDIRLTLPVGGIKPVHI